jgi:hypothetical protein
MPGSLGSAVGFGIMHVAEQLASRGLNTSDWSSITVLERHLIACRNKGRVCWMAAACRCKSNSTGSLTLTTGCQAIRRLGEVLCHPPGPQMHPLLKTNDSVHQTPVNDRIKKHWG